MHFMKPLETLEDIEKLREMPVPEMFTQRDWDTIIAGHRVAKRLGWKTGSFLPGATYYEEWGVSVDIRDSETVFQLNTKLDNIADILRDTQGLLQELYSFYGKNLGIANWHLNGELEPYDSLIVDDNMPENLQARIDAALKDLGETP